MERLGPVVQTRIKVEKVRLEFIETEINTAFTFARSAETLYGLDSTTHAKAVESKAWEAYNEAVKNLKMLSASRTLRDHLTAKLEQVRGVLDGLAPDHKRKLRVIRKNGKG